MSIPTIRTPAVATGTGTNVAGPGAYNSSLTVTKPSGTTNGDLLIAAILTDGSTLGAVQTLAGWTAHPSNPLTTTLDGSKAYLFSKEASGEPSSWTFLSDLNNGNDYTSICVAVVGQNATWNTDSAHSTVNNSSNSSPVSLSDSGVTTTVPDTLLLYFGFADPTAANSGSWTDPSGWTTGAQSFSNYCPAIVATKGQASTGSSGSAAATLTFSSGNAAWATIIIPIAPVSGGTTQALAGAAAGGATASATLTVTNPRQFSMTLYESDGVTLAANKTGLWWSWWDTLAHVRTAAANASGTGASTDASGVFTVSAPSGLSPGADQGFGIISDQDATADTAELAYVGSFDVT